MSFVRFISILIGNFFIELKLWVARFFFEIGKQGFSILYLTAGKTIFLYS